MGLSFSGEQRGVQIDQHLPVLGRRPGPAPHPLPGHRPRGADRPQRTVGVPGEPRDQPGHRRVRATAPNTPGWDATATSQAASPPRATATATSNTIFPGSWIARESRHGPSRVDSSLVSPLRRAVCTSSVPPACDTSDSPPVIADNHGLRCLSFTCEVPLNSVRSGSVQLRSNRAEQALSRICTRRVAHKINYGENLRLAV